MQLLLESAAARCAAEVMTLNSAMSACAMLGENGGQAALEDSVDFFWEGTQRLTRHFGMFEYSKRASSGTE